MLERNGADTLHLSDIKVDQLFEDEVLQSNARPGLSLHCSTHFMQVFLDFLRFSFTNSRFQFVIFSKFFSSLFWTVKQGGEEIEGV